MLVFYNIEDASTRIHDPRCLFQLYSPVEVKTTINNYKFLLLPFCPSAPQRLPSRQPFPAQPGDPCVPIRREPASHSTQQCQPFSSISVHLCRHLGLHADSKRSLALSTRIRALRKASTLCLLKDFNLNFIYCK